MVPEEYDEYDVLADTIFMVLYCFLETFWLSFIHYNTNLQGVPQYYMITPQLVEWQLFESNNCRFLKFDVRHLFDKMKNLVFKVFSEKGQ